MFDEANAIGLQHIDDIVKETPFDIYDLKKYYNLHLSYYLDERKRLGMKRFLQIINETRQQPV
jgi:chorismate dehydratase